MPETPSFDNLCDTDLRNRLCSLRTAVEPILALNHFSHFTDHSIKHSDRMCGIVDDLVKPIDSQRPLNDSEAFILYAACYYHDAGMQNQNFAELPEIETMFSEKYPGSLARQVSDVEKRDFLRTNHHIVSAQMVEECVNAHSPSLRLQLTETDNPYHIANLCEAHGLSTTTDRYQELSETEPDIRMPLLIALLRLADILDESQSRSDVQLTDMLALDTEAKTHWFRHHYVSNIDFDPSKKRIEVYFAYPPRRADEYSKILPNLQLPHLRGEIDKHLDVLNPLGIYWTVHKRKASAATSRSKREMPEDVLAFMKARIAQEHAERHHDQKLTALARLRMHRPLIKEQMDALKSEQCHEMRLRKALQLAKQLWSFGGHRDAWSLLQGQMPEQVKDDSDEIEPIVILEVGKEMCQMMLDAAASGIAMPELSKLIDFAKENHADNRLRCELLKLLARAYIAEFRDNDACRTIDELLSLLTDENEKSVWTVQRAEIEFLSGDLAATKEVLASQGGNDDS